MPLSERETRSWRAHFPEAEVPGVHVSVHKYSIMACHETHDGYMIRDACKAESRGTGGRVITGSTESHRLEPGAHAVRSAGTRHPRPKPNAISALSNCCCNSSTHERQKKFPQKFPH